MHLSASLQNRKLLEGKNALVIGGAGYLGSEITRIFLQHGARIIIASRDLSKIEQFIDSLESDSLREMVTPFSVDITQDDSVMAMTDFVGQKFSGTLDVLVNSGWSGRKNSLDSITMEDWNHDIEVCLTGVFRTIKSCLPLIKQSKGNILSIASMYGHVAPDYRIYQGNDFANPPSYGAAKAGVIQLTKYLASFLAEDQVRVNCISPGPFPFPETQNENPEFIRRLASKNPLGRIGEPHEIAGASLMLCSDLGTYINGQNLCVDGGWSSW
jgi:NAD(P)-dependent dehydrogenase (short-subunit alcohol dehydrogenase family)